VTHTTVLPFYRITRNLYLVKTPEMGPTGHSKIEDLFKASTLATTVMGKTFNPNDDIDTDKEYGKVVFAERVVAPNASKIDFSGFEPLLDRIVAVIAHHNSLVAAGKV